MSVIAIIIVLMVIFILLVWCLQVKETEFLKRLPVPPSSKPFLGIALDFTSTKDILKVLLNYVNTCGPLVIGKIGPFRQMLLIADYKVIELIVSSTSILTKSYDYHFLEPWLGKGLLTSDGAKWKKHRRALTPAFHFKILGQFLEVFESNGNTLVAQLQQGVGKSSVDIYPYITLYTLDVICESIMGVNINAQNDKNSDYVKSVKEMCRITVARTISPIEMHDFLFPFCKNYYIQKKALKILHKQSDDVISCRRKELEKISQNSKPLVEETYFKNKKAFLDLLLQTKIDGRFLTHQEIRDEVDTFMFEGHDTTASALSFTLYCLANYPDAQKKVFEEQQQIFQGNIDAPSTYDDLQNMKYLECVIKESLRLYPSVPIFVRKLRHDLKFGDETIPKGLSLTIFAFAIHRDPKYFKNPNEFIPERFEEFDGKFPYAYIPFSAGPRNCIGQKFAMLEMKSVISKLLRAFEFFPAYPEHKLELISETILKSENGICLAFKPRLRN